MQKKQFVVCVLMQEALPKTAQADLCISCTNGRLHRAKKCQNSLATCLFVCLVECGGRVPMLRCRLCQLEVNARIFLAFLWTKNGCFANTTVCVGQKRRDGSVYKGISIVVGARLGLVVALFWQEQLYMNSHMCVVSCLCAHVCFLMFVHVVDASCFCSCHQFHQFRSSVSM